MTVSPDASAAETAAAYSRVLSPIQIGNVAVPTRVVRTAHGTGLDTGSDLIAYHAVPARSGVGLTILDTATVHPNSIGVIRTETDAFLADYEKLITELHRYPMKLFQQLWHSGRTFAVPDGSPPWSSSAIPGPRVFHSDLSTVPLAVTRGQIDDLVQSFAAGARRVVEAGVDGVEIHSAHGYFLGQFLSPLTNLREDEYGGSLENRMRLLTEILRAVRAEVGHLVPVGVRISANEMVPGGLRTEEATEICRRLDQAGLLDFLDISLGSPMNYTKVIAGMEEDAGYELPFSTVVARSVGVPTIVGGRVKTLDHAERILADGDAQLVSMVRAHIADPELIIKTLRGTPSRVRPCIACNQGCVGARSSPGARFGCAVNPIAGNEKAEISSPRPHPLNVLVVGGGPAGMEAARTAALRGDHVVLCEAGDHLGGQLTLARKAPYRHEIGEITDWLAGELTALGVHVRLDTVVTAEYVRAEKPDRVIIATGSLPRTDGFQIADPANAVPGIDLPHVFTSWQILDSVIAPGTRSVVFDDIGHHEAISAVEVLLAQGHHVTLATRLNRIAPLLESARLETTIKARLIPASFEFVADVRLGRIEPGTVVLTSLYGGGDRTIPADAVIFVGSNRPQRTLADELGDLPGVRLVGDALGPRFLQLAMTEAHRVAMADHLVS